MTAFDFNASLAKQAHQTFDAAVAFIQKRDDCPPLNAIFKAMTEHPDLYEASAKAPPVVAKKIEKAVDDRIAKASKAIDDIAAEIRRPDESFETAYARALDQRPDLYTAYKAAHVAAQKASGN
ncbi:hypothetical protein LCM4576_23580 [Mesorhizobium sp. LCM 4576]|uniref:hypothetical protein n=1 Tax=Mesorhizobium sp. LCM 4576 TaxID=1848289 RepID=UPI0008DA6F63|nr:hypothetical protein [Mesorhizobium sp. LCM 4576]OHV67901.1 hypothetical protein LCM4576_23580 [Mesorhizobium sp. LCM 4576]